MSVKLLYVFIRLTDNDRHCADGNEAATLVFASASSEEEPDDDDDDQDQAEETNSTVSTGEASTIVNSPVSLATGSSNSTGFSNSTSSAPTTTSAPPPPPTAVSFCQPRDQTKVFCMAGSFEWEVISE